MLEERNAMKEPMTEEHYLPIACPLCGRVRLQCVGNGVKCEKCGAESDALADAQEEVLKKAGVSEQLDIKKWCHGCEMTKPCDCEKPSVQRGTKTE